MAAVAASFAPSIFGAKPKSDLSTELNNFAKEKQFVMNLLTHLSCEDMIITKKDADDEVHSENEQQDMEVTVSVSVNLPRMSKVLKIVSLRLLILTQSWMIKKNHYLLSLLITKSISMLIFFNAYISVEAMDALQFSIASTEMYAFMKKSLLC